MLAPAGLKSSSKLKEKARNLYRYNSCICKRSVLTHLLEKCPVQEHGLYPACQLEIIPLPTEHYGSLQYSLSCAPGWLPLCTSPSFPVALSIPRSSSPLQKYVSLCFTAGSYSSVAHWWQAAGWKTVLAGSSLILLNRSRLLLTR